MCKMTISCRHGNKCQNSWTGYFLRMAVLILSIIQLLVLLSKKCWVCNKLSDSCNSGWATAFKKFRPIIHVNNSLYSGCVGLNTHMHAISSWPRVHYHSSWSFLHMQWDCSQTCFHSTFKQAKGNAITHGYMHSWLPNNGDRIWN